MSARALATFAFCLEEFSDTKAMLAKSPIMEITTKSSIKVNPTPDLTNLGNAKMGFAKPTPAFRKIYFWKY